MGDLLIIVLAFVYVKACIFFRHKPQRITAEELDEMLK